MAGLVTGVPLTDDLAGEKMFPGWGLQVPLRLAVVLGKLQPVKRHVVVIGMGVGEVIVGPTHIRGHLHDYCRIRVFLKRVPLDLEVEKAVARRDLLADALSRLVDLFAGFSLGFGQAIDDFALRAHEFVKVLLCTKESRKLCPDVQGYMRGLWNGEVARGTREKRLVLLLDDELDI